ncbi:amino acid adenylation domain-containing protein, partial [Microbispora sp. NPDC046973]|uniref:amino acid adenylation domain-containing protein n=1 Tax=Microbispora sp. NPDC046973 TaxID=3155022 RepID=UPI0033FA1262
LNLDHVGVTDNFFDLGGHSLLATQAITRIRAAFTTDTGVAALFDHPTVGELAAVIDTGTASEAPPPIVPVSRERKLPLSFAQQRLWFLDQLHPGSSEYNISTPIHLPERLDVPALRAALDTLLERHEVLRTRLIADDDGVPWQVIDPPTRFDLPVVDVTGHDHPQEAARAWIAADAATPFDLATGPLIRATLLRLTDDEHVLALCMHHIVSDEWSAKIFFQELTTLYEAYRDDRPNPLPELPIQYADFAVWQHDWLTGPVLDEQLGYWRNQLADPPVLELPTDRPRPPVRSTTGAAISFQLNPEITARLRELSRKQSATMFMTLATAYTVLLNKYTGQDDVLVGTRVANRNHGQTEALIGFFVNTLALRADLSGDPTFTELLARVRATALDAYTHQDLPFEQLVDELGITRDRSRTPLFQTLFSYTTEDPRTDGTRAQAGEELRHQDGIVARFDLRLIFIENGDALSGVVEYSTALFDRPTVERLIGHLTCLLGAVSDESGRSLSALPILTLDEHERILDQSSGPATGPLPASGVHELIAARAAAQPGAAAVVDGGATLTYADLDARANRLAHHLRAMGAGPETVIGLCLPPGADVVTAVLGIWKAGAVYLPLDPAHPAERLAYLLADSGAAVLVTVGALGGLGGGRVPVLVLDDPATQAGLAARPDTAPEVAVNPEQGAYLIYTSGSTGRPKGVTVTHRNLVNYLEVAPSRIHLGDPGARYALLQPAVTDFGNTIIYTCLTTGGTLHLPDPAVATDGDRVAAYLADHHIDYLKIVPSHLAALTHSVAADRLLPERTLILGGEATTPAQLAHLRAHLTTQRLVNHYGPTETTIGTITADLTTAPSPASPGQAVPIGTPLPNTAAYVLDAHLAPVPDGVPGDLYIAGPGLARGYRGRFAMTAERFVANPFGQDGERFYRTGDRARRRPDGQIEFLGRADHQIKLRGHRIEPAEIEQALTDIAGVGAALVTLHEQRLVAYLVPAGELPTVSELRDHLRASLPDHMVPSAFVELNAFPRTANGKVDRTALPAPDDGRPDLADAYQAPSTEAEESLAGIWADVLGLDRVGVRDDFFTLGGHSLLAVKAVSRMRATGYDIGLGDLFDHPTIAELTRLTTVSPEAMPEREFMVRIRWGTRTPAIFGVHSVTGAAGDLAGLARHLTAGQQFYGLQARGLDGERTPLESVGEMAEAYLDEVVAVQEQGPYLFAAWSMGGYVAIEMARRAAARGLEVGGVFLAGPPLHGSRRGVDKARDDRRLRTLMRHIDTAIAAPQGTRLTPAQEERLLQLWPAPGDLADGLRAGDKQALRVARVVVANSVAVLHHRGRGLTGRGAKPYEGRVVLFVPQDDPQEIQVELLEQWRSMLRDEPEILYVPGTHEAVVRDEGAARVGARLREEIARCERARDTGR